jgi:hypothetical protein
MEATMRKATLAATVLWLFLLSATAALAQQHDPNDRGVTDTIEMMVSVVPRAATSQLKVQLDLWATNDSNIVASAAMGFKWINANLKMDSARFSDLARWSFDYLRIVYYGSSLAQTNANKAFAFVGARQDSIGMAMSATRQLWCRYYMSLSSWTVNDSIIIDTNTYNSGVTYKFVDDSLKNYRAFWVGKKVIHDVDYVAPSTLNLTPDTLAFTHIYSQLPPAGQTFSITSTPNSIAYTITENSPWILKSPALGNTPATITVTINPTGLPIGTYFDSLIVASGSAVNSPQIKYVRLNVIAPPPVISASPTQLFFSGVVGGSNPAPKNLIIKNTAPGSVLHWSLAHAQPWLSYTPSSGTDSQSVQVSVDITGIPYGTFKDTIVITDPAATNNPVKVPVFLQMGSNLPIIVADSQVNFFVVNLTELIQFSRYVTIRNGGAGQLDFKLTESSSRIFTLTPDTASAPQQIQVGYKMSGVVDGQQVTDTFWVRSDQAVNSPYPVVMILRFVQDPASIGTSTDTIKFDVYECSQGLGTLPSQSFYIQNVGQDDPMVVHVAYSSDRFTINKTSATAPSSFLVTALFPDIPVGVYYDTILISAQNAVNTPRRIIVQYNRISATQPPEIGASRQYWPIPYFENSGPSYIRGFDLNNNHGGCMPWSVHENIPWLEPTDTAGNVPTSFDVIVDAPGYLLGSYDDSMTFTSDGATNSPLTLPVQLRVWRFHGDWDWDGRLDISDITAMIAYNYFGGVPPRPTYLVGDCDCDDRVDIADITRLIDYLYLFGPVMCGNPY